MLFSGTYPSECIKAGAVRELQIFVKVGKILEGSFVNEDIGFKSITMVWAA